MSPVRRSRVCSIQYGPPGPPSGAAKASRGRKPGQPRPQRHGAASNGVSSQAVGSDCSESPRSRRRCCGALVILPRPLVLAWALCACSGTLRSTYFTGTARPGRSFRLSREIGTALHARESGAFGGAERQRIGQQKAVATAGQQP